MTGELAVFNLWEHMALHILIKTMTEYLPPFQHFLWSCRIYNTFHLGLELSISFLGILGAPSLSEAAAYLRKNHKGSEKTGFWSKLAENGPFRTRGGIVICTCRKCTCKVSPLLLNPVLSTSFPHDSKQNWRTQARRFEPGSGGLRGSREDPPAHLLMKDLSRTNRLDDSHILQRFWPPLAGNLGAVDIIEKEAHCLVEKEAHFSSKLRIPRCQWK